MVPQQHEADLPQHIPLTMEIDVQQGHITANSVDESQQFRNFPGRPYRNPSHAVDDILHLQGR